MLSLKVRNMIEVNKIISHKVTIRSLGKTIG